LDIHKKLFDAIRFQIMDTLPQTEEAFKALVDAIIPVTPELAEKHGAIYSSGGLDLHVDEYQIWSLDHYLSLYVILANYNANLSNVTAEVLNLAARQLIDQGENKMPINPEIDPEAGTFAALDPVDRFRAITLLEQLKVDVGSFPLPYSIYPSFIPNSSASLALLAILGYYTEWSGYGSTRLATPEKRQLEHFPIGWKQAGYPGPSKGYRVLRGYLIEKFTE
jgi:hypothetical protein